MNEGKETAQFPPKLNLIFRRQMLGDLEQRFNSLEEGGRSMVEQVMNCSHYNQNIYFSLPSDLYFLSRRSVWQLSNQRKDGLAFDFVCFSYSFFISCLLDLHPHRQRMLQRLYRIRHKLVVKHLFYYASHFKFPFSSKSFCVSSDKPLFPCVGDHFHSAVVLLSSKGTSLAMYMLQSTCRNHIFMIISKKNPLCHQLVEPHRNSISFTFHPTLAYHRHHRPNDIRVYGNPCKG